MSSDFNAMSNKLNTEFLSSDTISCDFCNIDENRIVDSNELTYCIRDDEPLTKYHSLIIPKRHAVTYFDLYQTEVVAVFNLILKQKEYIESMDKTVTGFNVSINSGKDAGQTVLHCHLHLIPRRKGDVVNSKEGILK